MLGNSLEARSRVSVLNDLFSPVALLEHVAAGFIA